jgi:hypothetical protein
MGMLTSYGLPLIPVSRPENKEIFVDRTVAGDFFYLVKTGLIKTQEDIKIAIKFIGEREIL